MTTTKGKTHKAKQSARHLVEELEDEFHSLQSRIGKARSNYVASHQKEIAATRKKIKSLQSQMSKAKKRITKAAVQARKSGTRTAESQLKKARAASLLIGNSLSEAKDILATKQDKLKAARPFDRKLAARAKVLEKFERDWDKKMQAEAASRAKRAKRAAAKRRARAKSAQ